MKKIFTLLSAVCIGLGAFAQGQTQLLIENFNGTVIPTNWSQVTAATDGGWKFGSAASLSSSAFTIPSTGSNIAVTNDDGCNCVKSSDLLITDYVDLTSYGSVHVSFKMFYYHASYQGSQENAAFLYSTDNGTSWTTAKNITTGSSVWQDMYIDVSGAGLNDSVLFAFRYGDGGGWTYGMGVDNFAVYVPYNYDFTTASLDMYPVQGLNNAPFTFTGEISNVGSQTVNAFNVNYSINGGAAQTTAVTGANLAAFGKYQYTTSAATAWTPAAAGTYTVKIWASSLDGSPDQNLANDTLTATIQVIPQTVQRQVLVEEFTSSTCPPCASFNAQFTPIINANSPNTANGKINVVKYQMNWPSPGTDPNYNPDGNTRKSYYGVSGVPNPFMDANDGFSSQAQIDALYAIPAVVEINGSWGYSGEEMYCTVNVTPKANVTGNLKLRVAVVEKQINVSDFAGYPVTNGETSFSFVQRKMFPNAGGFALTGLTPNVTTSFYHQAAFKLGGVAQGNSNIWYGMNQLEVVAWVQNDADKSVLQSATIEAMGIGVNEFEDVANALNIYPNPANTFANVVVDLKQDANVSISLLNSLGQVVLNSTESMNAGYNSTTLSIADLATGIYILTIDIDGVSTTKRVAVTR